MQNHILRCNEATGLEGPRRVGSSTKVAGHVVHLAAPMRQVAQHGKLREVRRRVLSEAGAL